jgi:hypothetical protein
MRNKEISLNVRGNVKQLQAVKYWIDDTTIDIAYGGSKGCIVGSTLVRTLQGLIPIKNVKVGDYVLTINEATKQNEYKLVLDTKKFSTEGYHHYHKMITFVMKNGESFSLTPNHEIYDNGNWTPAGEFAERILEGNNEWVSNINFWSGSFSQAFWQKREYHFKTLYDKEGLLKNLFKHRRGKEATSDTPISCISFHRKSSIKAYSKSHQLRQEGQSSRESRMGNRQRECSSFKKSFSSIIRYSWRRCMELKAKFRKGFRDTGEVQAENLHKRDVSTGVWSKSINDKRRDTTSQLEAHLIESIRYEVLDDYVYDLCVDSNNNYCLTSDNIIVHNSGKSFLGCSLICADALMYPGTHYFIARKTLTDLRKFTIPSVHEILDIWGIGKEYYKYNGQDNYFHFHNGSKIFLLDAKYQPSDPNYMRFGSMQMTRGWIEEAGEFELECKNNLQASIGRWKNKEYNLPPKLLQTCNPSKNYLYKDYYKLDIEKNLPIYRKFIQALPSDNKTLPKEYIPNLINILSPNEIQRLVYGNWEFDDNPYALFDYQDILGLYTNEFIKPTEDRYITADIAYTGADKFVIMVWAGFVVVKIIAIDKIDDTMVSKKINELRVHYRVPLKNVVYDADGLQTFTRNSSQSGNLVGAVGFHNNAVPIKVQGKKENFKNLKAQVYEFFAQQVKDSKVFIQDNAFRKQVIEELEQINKNPILDDGKYALEPKSKVRERLGRSPDFADALAMRFYFELKGKPKVMIRW